MTSSVCFRYFVTRLPQNRRRSSPHVFPASFLTFSQLTLHSQHLPLSWLLVPPGLTDPCPVLCPREHSQPPVWAGHTPPHLDMRDLLFLSLFCSSKIRCAPHPPPRAVLGEAGDGVGGLSCVHWEKSRPGLSAPASWLCNSAAPWAGSTAPFPDPSLPCAQPSASSKFFCLHQAKQHCPFAGSPPGLWCGRAVNS